MRKLPIAVVTAACLLALPIGIRAQVDPAGTSTSQTSTTTADPNAPTTDTTETSTTATDTMATTAASDTTGTVTPTEGSISWLHRTFELETIAWLLPLVAFIAAILLGLALHAALVSHDVRNWPRTSGSWWKLRFPPLLLGVALIIGSYFLVIRGLDEELLRVADPRARLWVAVYLVMIVVLWLLPRPGIPGRTVTTQESV